MDAEKYRQKRALHSEWTEKVYDQVRLLKCSPSARRGRVHMRVGHITHTHT